MYGHPLRRAVAAALFLLSCLPSPAAGQIRTVGGDPLMAVADPSRAVPVAATTGKKKEKVPLPPLAVDQTVRLVAEKDGAGLVAVEAAEAATGRDGLYRIPMADLRQLPGRTHTVRPDWLPAPGPTEAARRDVVAFEDLHGFVSLVTDGQKPRRLVKGRFPAVAPDAGLAAVTPDDDKGVLVLSLAGDGRRVRLAPGSLAVREKSFSPDGRRLAWRVADRIELADLDRPDAPPAVVARDIPFDKSLQGFTRDGRELVLQDLELVTWLGLDGQVKSTAAIGEFTEDPWGSSADHYLPSPAADGLMLVERGVFGTQAFETWADGPSAALYLCDAKTGTNFRLTPKSIAAVDPALSPDGRRVYFAGLPDAPRGGGHRLFRVNSDGTGLTEIAPAGWRPSAGTRP